MKNIENIKVNRSSKKWSRKELVGRVLWALGRLIFSLSPRPLWGLRRGLLRLFGANIGNEVRIHPSVRVTIPWNLTIGDAVGIGDRVILYALGPIKIGACSTISQGAHLCAGSHDHADPTMPLTKPPITIGANVWVCADTFIGPDVTVGDRSILGARSVVISNVPANVIYGGNPAKKIKERLA